MTAVLSFRKTANIISGFRPKAKIIAVTNQIEVLNRLELIWGLQTLSIDSYQSMDDVLNQVDKLLIQFGLAKTGDRIILTLGQPIENGSKTNSLYVHIVGGEKEKRTANENLPLRFQELETDN